MQRRWFPVSAFLVLLALTATAARAQAPEMLSSQGVLTLSDGTMVPDGVYAVRFSVWDAPALGNESFEQTLQVQVKDGLYNVLLTNQGGWSLTTAFGGSPRYMDVAITSVPAGSGLTPPITLTPRQQVASVPYALAARGSAAQSPPEWTSPASLLNGWTRYVGDPGASYSPFGYYKDASSRVYLRGVIQGGPGNAEIFVLPPGYRPQYTLILPCVTQPSTPLAQAEIFPDGRIRIWRSNGNDALLSSLDGLSFRAEQ